MAQFAFTILLSALLLFQVQPILGRILLPWFGGSAAVWTVCLMFFQFGLLAGYAYAHMLIRRLSVVGQAGTHLTLLLFSLWFLPMGIEEQAARISPGGWPTPQILIILAANIGLPFVLMACTTPLLTAWFCRWNRGDASRGASPFRLYALSNAGSLIALVSYPFLVEPYLTLAWQCTIWSWSYLLLVLAFAWCAVIVVRASASSTAPLPVPAAEDEAAPANAAAEPSAGNGPPRRGTILLWLALSACGSTMLVATTNQLCQDVAVVPFLWVLPLALYLITYIVCFDNPRWYRRKYFISLLALLALPTCAVLYAGPRTPFVANILAYCLTLLAACMICHGELARAKPHARYATLFYLCIAGGGALGGAFVALAAPWLFPGYWEYHLALLCSCLLAAVASHRNGAWNFRRERSRRQLIGIGLVVLAVVLGGEIYYGGMYATVVVRNFYGVLRLTSGADSIGPYRQLLHGRIDHGVQYTAADQRRWPTLYFGRGSAIDLAMRRHPRRRHADPTQRSLRIGVIGLGTGTIAAHGRQGDMLRFYEIDPAVVRLCQQYFTFVQDSAADVQIVLGDGRVSLQRELDQGRLGDFDVLAVDAFRSGAIPIHLLTRQCAEIYFRHLRPDGILLLHVSNNFVDLTPVARGLGRHFNRTAVRVLSHEDRSHGTRAGVWVLLTSNQEFLRDKSVVTDPWTPSDPPPLLWSDDFASLRQVLK